MSALVGLLVLLAGAVSFIMLPVCVVGYYVCVSKLGAELVKIDPVMWVEIKPRLFKKVSQQTKQRERINLFIREREYLSYNNERISVLGNGVLLFDRGTTIFGFIWFAVFFWMILR